ncbi:capsid assembly scaffolding protein Gp46 family protein [Micromonospora okii]|uniref:capsid assembly scaffolding protein Gp46 family protein n=1 Tax=Micromonospora okii TaxID=1182970 RepID=UPI001E30669A|nr:DUF4355 domain-containing protein [Micromonospora okii]
MSDPTPAPAPSAPPPATDPAPAPAPVTLDGPYDEARGTRLIANLRAELAELKAQRAAPEVAELRSQLDALTADLTRTRLDAARAEAATAAGVPAHLAAYVNGATAEEIKASAERVAADFAATRTPADPLPAMPRPAPTPGRAPADAAPAFDPVATARAARGY